jgi:hypothetical protein
VQIGDSGPNAFNDYFVSSGNLVVAATDIGPSYTTNAIDTCNPGNTWSSKTLGTFFPYFFYLTSAGSFSTSLSCTIHSSNTGNNEIMVIYDVVGAATSPFDSFGPGGANNGAIITDPVTPTNQPGIAFASEGTGDGPTLSLNGAGMLFDNTPYAGETDTGQLNNGDGWAHYFYSSTSPITFSWNQANTSSYMEASAITFDADPNNSPTRPNPPTGLKAAVQTVP